ncbi:hypothetical protein ACIHDR_48125, partial [Nocardia sp. NPDC052278]|uniref:hypothetical protein n=1 Tax=unclassified Nocardia TaxID=2637762 RepID=UPI0036B9292B
GDRDALTDRLRAVPQSYPRSKLTLSTFSGEPQTYSGQTYKQDRGDCVAASTVVARAAKDPVFMLGLTTGQGPATIGGDKPGEDSVAAFSNRLKAT